MVEGNSQARPALRGGFSPSPDRTGAWNDVPVRQDVYSCPSGLCAWPRAPWTHPVSIPNLVVPHGSAGEYCTGNRVGGEAAAHTPEWTSK